MVCMRAMVLALAIAGCSHASVDSGGLHVHIEAGRSLATVLGLSFVAARIVDDAQTAPPAEMDPHRKVSEQDCTKPIDYSLGNIRCR